VKKGEMLSPPSEDLIPAIKAPEPEPIVPITEEAVEASGGFSGRLVIELSELPDKQSYKKFISLLKSVSGSNDVTIKTPDGDIDLPLKTGIGVDMQTQISMLLGGARVYFAGDEVDPMAVLAGMTL